ncbi:MAG: Dopa 45-dioxygenase [Cyanobacteria bacterium RYN_339]|nr:Dopa 45-dioxygenase [Cyanobacteria bacterium RYN_339]
MAIAPALGYTGPTMLIDAPEYHAHLYFEPEDHPAVTAIHARALAEVAGKVWPIRSRPVGPHPCPMFEIEFNHAQRPAVLAWLEANRGAQDVLVHPVTGDDLVDHRDHATWLGNAHQLDFSRL